MVDVLQLATGVDIPVEELGITIHQPRIEEISILGQDKYLIALQLFSFSPQNLPLQDKSINSWTILNQVIQQKIDGIKDTRQLLINFLQLFFKEKLNFGPRSLMLVGKDAQVKNIEPENIDTLQSIVKSVGGYFLIDGQKEEEFKPANKMAAQIAEKMKKARERLAKVKAFEAGGNGQAKSFINTMIAAVTTKTANSLEQVNQMTLYQLNMIFKTYLNWESFELEVRTRLAGGGQKGEKNLVHWTQVNDNDNIATY